METQDGWRKSSRSGGSANTNCVEVKKADDARYRREIDPMLATAATDPKE